MKVVAIGDCVRPVESWNPLKATGEDDFTYIDLSAIDQERKQIVEARNVACAEAPSRARQLVEAGDVLVSTVRPNLNGVARVGVEHHGATVSTGFCVLRPKAETLDGGYAFQWIKSPSFVADMVSKATGASYPAVSDRIILESRIPLPPLSQQRRIAAILDQADALRAKRREALAQLDALTQSIFVEMFGVRTLGESQFQLVAVDELCSRITVGIVVQPAGYYRPSGVPALRSLNIRQNRIELESLVFFSHEDNETTLAKTKVRAGDVLIVRTGQPGTAAIVPPELEGVNAIDILIATPKLEKVLPDYLCHFLNSDVGRAIVLGAQRGQVQKHLNLGSLKSANIPYPPLDLQRTFATRIKAVESLKATHRAALTESDALFASLQHRAFAGQLL